jgi:hypothetical protein
MIIIINHGNTPIYTKRQQAKALTTVANLIDKLQTAIHHYCRRQITTSWKSWIKTCHDEANALTEPHDAMTRAIFVQLTRVIAQCQLKDIERYNYFTILDKGLKEITQILNYRGHPQRRHRQHKTMTLKLQKFKAQQTTRLGMSISSITTKNTLSGLANYLDNVINIIRNEE